MGPGWWGGGGVETGPIWDRAAASQVCTDGWGPGLELSAPEGSLHPVGVRPAPHNRKPNLSAQPSPALQAGAPVSRLLLFRAPPLHPSWQLQGSGDWGGGEVCELVSLGATWAGRRGPTGTHSDRRRHTPKETGGCGRAWWAGVGMSALGGPSPTCTSPQGHGGSHGWTPTQSLYSSLRAGERPCRGGATSTFSRFPAGVTTLTGETEAQMQEEQSQDRARGGVRARSSGEGRGAGAKGGRGPAAAREKTLVREAGQGRRDIPSRVPPCPQPPGSLQRCSRALPGSCL